LTKNGGKLRFRLNWRFSVESGAFGAFRRKTVENCDFGGKSSKIAISAENYDFVGVTPFSKYLEKSQKLRFRR
jgi:hypothetical protein